MLLRIAFIFVHFLQRFLKGFLQKSSMSHSDFSSDSETPFNLLSDTSQGSPSVTSPGANLGIRLEIYTRIPLSNCDGYCYKHDFVKLASPLPVSRECHIKNSVFLVQNTLKNNTERLRKRSQLGSMSQNKFVHQMGNVLVIFIRCLIL